MEVLVKRRNPIGPNTPGDLSVDGKAFGHTCEDLVREIGPNGEGKIDGETAIPAGRYRAIIGWSNRFKKNMIRLQDVPHFTGILAHGGNTAEDTHGCILVGYELTDHGSIKPGTSTPAIRALFALVEAAIGRGEEVWFTVENV